MKTSWFVEGRGARGLLLCAAAVIAIVGLSLARAFVVPMLLGAVVATAALPLLRLLVRRGFPPAAAVAVTMAAVLLSLSAGGLVLAMAADEFTSDLGNYLLLAQRGISSFQAWLLANRFDRVASGVQHLDLMGDAGTIVTSGVWSAAQIASGLLIIVLLCGFILHHAASTTRSDGARPLLERDGAFAGPLYRLQRFLAVKGLISLVTGLCAGVLCMVLGVKGALLWGVVAFALNFVPFVGSILAALPPVLIAAVDGGLLTTLLLGGGYLLLNLVLGNIIEPLAMGVTMRLTPLAVFVSVMLWGAVLGPVGALLSAPLTMVLAEVFDRTDDLRWIAGLVRSTRPRPGLRGRLIGRGAAAASTKPKARRGLEHERGMV